MVNGSVYGPGSAMDSSSFCEYCYCLRGKQICVKPKCLLPVDGCVPMYEDTNCCPVHYNCTYKQPTTSTTTIKPNEIERNQGMSKNFNFCFKSKFQVVALLMVLFIKKEEKS